MGRGGRATLLGVLLLLLLLPGCASLLGGKPADPDGAAECSRDLSWGARPMVRREPTPGAPSDASLARRLEGHGPLALPPAIPQIVQAYLSMKPRTVERLDGELVACIVKALKPGGLDVDIVLDPSLRWNNAPDLRVEVYFGKQRYLPVFAQNANKAIFNFFPKLKSGDQVVFEVEDSDWFSANEKIGTVRTKFEGKLPILLGNDEVAVECRAATRAQRAAAVDPAEKKLRAYLAEYQSFEPSFPGAPLPPALSNDVGRQLQVLQLWRGERHPSVAEWKQRFRRVNAGFQRAYLDRLDQKHRSAAKPGTWVSISPEYDVRVLGLLCPTTGYARFCATELEVRVQQSLNLCPVSMSDAGPVGGFKGYFLDGMSVNLGVGEVYRDGKQVLHERELVGLSAGDIYSVTLPIRGGYLASKDGSHEGWRLALIRHGDTFLRVY